MRNSQSFEDKLLTALIILFFIKILYLFFTINSLTPVAFFSGLLSSIFVFLLLMILARGLGKMDGSYSSSGSSGSSVLLRESIFDKLQRQYRELAEKYAAEKNYAKASYVYLKLLKDEYAAAEVLEKGQLYNEAAAIYLKYLQNKHKAAECYEKARAYKEAVKLYSELGETEKAGDIYLLLNDKTAANKCYLEVIDGYIKNFQYVKASLVYRNKINDALQAQELLLKGWRTNTDAYNCLNNYFENFKDNEELKDEIASIYENDTTAQNRESFLQLMKHEFKKDASLEELTRGIAYEIVAEKIDGNAQISSELIHFNRNNMSISKDIIKFKMNRKRATQ